MEKVFPIPALCGQNTRMDKLLSKIMPWGPVFFGALIFAPMWSAALDANLAVMVFVGLIWGWIAKVQGRWL